jgi:hypothetical protein
MTQDIETLRICSNLSAPCMDSRGGSMSSWRMPIARARVSSRRTVKRAAPRRPASRRLPALPTSTLLASMSATPLCKELCFTLARDRSTQGHLTPLQVPGPRVANGLLERSV